MSTDIKENNSNLTNRYRPEIDGLRAFAVLLPVKTEILKFIYSHSIVPGGLLVIS